MQNIILPPTLNSAIDGESIDFSVKAERLFQKNKSFFPVFIGIVLCGFICTLMILAVIENFSAKNHEIENQHSIAGIIMPIIFFSVSLFVGIRLLYAELYSLFKKGGYFVGTPTRLIYYLDGNFKSINWEQFSGEIEVKGDSQKGDIILTLRTGEIFGSENSPDEYVPDIVCMIEIPNPLEVEKICRKRIKENDPTPPSSKT